MADGTRSQESNRQLEEGINSLLKVHRDALKKGIASLRTLVLETQGRSNSFSPHQSEHGQGSQGRNYSQNPTRFSGLEFPKFNGDDFRGWLYKGEQFFGIDETAPDSKGTGSQDLGCRMEEFLKNLLQEQQENFKRQIEGIRNMISKPKFRQSQQDNSGSSQHLEQSNGNSHDSHAQLCTTGKIDFPRFNGDDFRDWFYKCERFFDVEQTPPDVKVRLAVMHLEGRALKWHGVFMKARLTREIPSWEEYIKALEARFGNSAYMESMSNSMCLWKQDSIQNFQKPFEVSNKNSSGINHLQRSSMILFSQSHKSGEKFEIEDKQLVFDKSPDREEQPTSEVPKVSNTCYKIGMERQSHSLDSHEIELEDFYKFFRGSDSVQQDNDLVVGAVVSGNENRLDVNVGADLLGTMLTKEVLPLYHKEMSYLLCEVEMDAEETMVNGKVGIVKNDAAVSGEAMPGRPVVEPGTILFAEVLGRTLSGRPLLSTRRLFRHLAWHRVRQIKQLNEPIMVKVTEWNTGGLFTRLEELRAFLPKIELMKRGNSYTEMKEKVGRWRQHIFEVSAGLDSLVLGEGQILAQVKQIVTVGQGVVGFGRNISGLFKHAVTVGKRIRTEKSIAAGAVSVELALMKLPESSHATARMLAEHQEFLGKLTEVKLTVVTTQVFKGWAEVVTKFRGGTLQYSELPL